MLSAAQPMLRRTTQCVLPCHVSALTRSMSNLNAVEQLYSQKVKEMKNNDNNKPTSPKFSHIPCIDATKLVAGAPRKQNTKVKVYRKKLRFIKNGMDKIQPYWIPSPSSPMYNVIVQTRNILEYARRERERQENVQKEHNLANENKEAAVADADEDVDIRKFLSTPEAVMSKKEAKLAQKGKEKKK